MDTMSLKEIQSKLLLWEAPENPLAPLTADQREAILDLESLITGVCNDTEESSQKEPNNESDASLIPSVDSTYDFLSWYESLCDKNVKADDSPYEAYYRQLEDRRNECVSLNSQIGDTIADLNKLSEQYELVSNKTNALHMMSEQLLADQNKLSSIGDDIKKKLHYFTQVEHLSQRLNSPTMSVNSETFFIVLAKIDECLEYMKKNNSFREAHTYLVKYRHLQSRAIGLIRSYVNHILNHATEQVLSPSDEDPADPESMDTAYAVYFGKFQAAAPKLRLVISEVEKRADSNPDYALLLGDLQREYATRRRHVAGGATASALAAAARTHGRDHCSLFRAACSLLAHACRDEVALYNHLFAQPSQALQEYLQSLCNGLYETLRPAIIHINHLETLAELCVILRVEVIEEQVNNDLGSLRALGECARALLQDAQERLVFRAHVHLRADVLHYRPAPGDLAYPDKLEMMEQIALSIQEQSLKRSDSRNSIISDISASSQEVANINVEAQRRPQASPADLHGMWYPGVRRTLAALSRLYRCLEKKVFQGLAQEAISLCVQSIDNAAKQISANKTNIDGELFQIKHLLILREQIAPFQVDFIVKETTLDFSNMKNAAYGLIQRPRQIFSLNSNNALLEFLLEGTPQVREHLLDSRKEVDRQLKASCETFIKDATELLAGPIIAFVEKAQQFAPTDQLKSQPWAAPEQTAALVAEAQRRVKSQLAPLQRSMQLYLANKETEFILFRPIRNNVVGYFVQIEQTLTNAGYSEEDLLIAACPTPEQVSVFISSASLVSRPEPVAPYGRKRSTTRKPSILAPPPSMPPHTTQATTLSAAVATPPSTTQATPSSKTQTTPQSTTQATPQSAAVATPMSQATPQVETMPAFQPTSQATPQASPMAAFQPVSVPQSTSLTSSQAQVPPSSGTGHLYTPTPQSALPRAPPASITTPQSTTLSTPHATPIFPPGSVSAPQPIYTPIPQPTSISSISMPTSQSAYMPAPQPMYIPPQSMPVTASKPGAISGPQPAFIPPASVVNPPIQATLSTSIPSKTNDLDNIV